MKRLLIILSLITGLILSPAYASFFGAGGFNGGFVTVGGYGLADMLATSPYALWIVKPDSYTTADGNDINVNQLNDLSGNSRHLNAGSSGAYPDYTTDGLGVNADSLLFNGADNRMANTSGMAGTNNTNSRTLIIRCEFQENGVVNQECGAITTNANINSGAHILRTHAGLVYLREFYQDGHNEAIIISGTTLPYSGVFALRSDAVTGKFSAFKDGVKLGEEDGANALPTANNRFYFGSPLTSQDFKGHFGGGGIWTKALTDQEILDISNFLNGTPSDVTLAPRYIFAGDSIINDPASGGYVPSAFSILEDANPSGVFIDVAVNGQTAATIDTNYATQIGLNFKHASSSNNLILLAGTNDIAGSASGADTFAEIESIVSKATSTGYNVFVCTVLDRSPNTYDSVIGDLNTLILGGSGYTVIDLAGVSELSDGSNTTYFYDGVHLTVAGHEVVADTIGTALGLSLAMDDINPLSDNVVPLFSKAPTLFKTDRKAS